MSETVCVGGNLNQSQVIPSTAQTVPFVFTHTGIKMASPQMFILQQTLMNPDWPRPPVSSAVPLISHQLLWIKAWFELSQLLKQKAMKGLVWLINRTQHRAFGSGAPGRINGCVVACCVRRQSPISFHNHREQERRRLERTDMCLCKFTVSKLAVKLTEPERRLLSAPLTQYEV